VSDRVTGLGLGLDQGSGTILTIAILGAVVALTLGAIPTYMGLAARQALTGAADAAALAAADAASGAVAGVPCERASRLATANDGRLDACRIDGYVVTVEVSRTVIGIRVSAIATAGPPGSPH
jgi:secretion/DNA translocation related TadE-like protein